MQVEPSQRREHEEQEQAGKPNHRNNEPDPQIAHLLQEQSRERPTHKTTPAAGACHGIPFRLQAQMRSHQSRQK